MKKYTITFKKSNGARKLFVWERFAKTIEDATTSARQALDVEYYGAARIVSIAEA
jgi:hypothetical protein